MRLIRFCALVAVAATIVPAQEETPDKRLRHATDTMREIMAAPDKAIPQGLLDRSRCIVIVPGMKKAAFIFGGAYGAGYAMCRNEGRWSGPAPIRLTGGSFGLQLGVDSTDVVMLVMNDKGLQHLLQDKFKIGADVAGAAGPVGRNTSANTDVLLHAEIITWSRSRGLFGGVSLDGTVVEHDDGETEKIYGKKLGHREILTGAVRPPVAARVLVKEMDEIAPGGPKSN